MKLRSLTSAGPSVTWHLIPALLSLSPLGTYSRHSPLLKSPHPAFAHHLLANDFTCCLMEKTHCQVFLSAYIHCCLSYPSFSLSFWYQQIMCPFSFLFHITPISVLLILSPVSTSRSLVHLFSFLFLISSISSLFFFLALSLYMSLSILKTIVKFSYRPFIDPLANYLSFPSKSNCPPSSSPMLCSILTPPLLQLPRHCSQ